MRRYSQRHGMSTLSELNITPLLDLAFVLLIIFMITTPLLENEVNLVAPTSDIASTTIDPSKVRTIEIDRFEKMKLDNEAITLPDLETELAQMHSGNNAEAVIIRPHKDLPIQKVVNIMDVLQKIGITRVGVATRSEGE